MKNNQNITVRRGQSKTINVTLTDDETGAVLSLLSNQVLQWQVLSSKSSTTPLLRYYISQGIEYLNAAQGRVKITISVPHTLNLSPGHYYHIFWVSDPSMTPTTPAFDGRLEVIDAGPGA